MGSYRKVATVVVKSVEVVAAGVFPVAESWLAMSNLDLILPPFAVGVFMCYDGDDKKNDEISMLKKGLRQVLVSFYPLAGEVVMNKDGEPELLCNNRGADFVQAAADIDLHHLDIYNPDVSIHAKFVPIKKNGVLSVQVTAMKCGGLVIGCSFDHRVADAHSINKFLVAWAYATSYYCKNGKDNNENNIIKLFSFDKYMNKNNNITSYRQSLLNPRRPGHHDTAIDNMYTLIKDVPALKDGQSPPSFHLQSRIYQISANQIQNLQSEAGPGKSKFESFSAFIWKLLAKAGKEDKKRCKLGIVVNGRKCLSRTCDNKTSSMENYFGNVLSVPYSDASVGELKALPLCKVANIVHACVESTANEEHFRGVVDWVEDKRPHQPLCKVYTWEPSETEEVAVVVSSGQRFPVSQLDFGWGSPSFASYYFPWGGFSGYVMPLPIATHDGDWIVYMYLFPKHLLFIEKEVPHIFKPFHF